ncbi:MAG: type II secretion system protein [Lentisphaeria bacterium]|nr:type II secretion system protein [Bacillota bacterium]MBR4255284.1 type II secretion system protein [Lentisphaeria bacterium]
MMVWNQNKKGRIRRRCFTLMELVAAAGIMLSIAGIIAFASRSFFRALASAERVSAQLQVYLNIDQVMDGCFRNMIPFNWETTDENDDTFQVFLGEEDWIHFTTLRRSYDDVGGNLFFVRVYVDDKTDELVAEYSKFPRLPWYEDDEDIMPYDREVLATNVDRVSFLYAGQQDSAVIWMEVWNRDNYDFIPLAVQMTVEWKDGTTEQWLRRTAASGGNSVYGAVQEVDE